MSASRYAEAVDYLERRLWHELPIIPVERAMQSRILRLLEHFGSPHRAFPVVHVGGSAGKGSTSTITASILRAAGLRTGLYMSPHLQTFVERISVDGRLMPPARFADAVLGLDPLVRRMHIDVLDGIGHGRPSLVEVPFAVGMRHFADEKCDAGVIEVGLGGRNDCTNVFDAAPVIAITNVDLEHRERLGWTRAAIATQKAGIVHGPSTVVTAATARDALAVIEARCTERGATLLRYGRQIRTRVTAADAAGSTFDIDTPFGSIAGLRLPLAGAHQVANAALATAAAQAFGEAKGRAVSDDAIHAGLATVRISGRLEAVQQSPLVLLDSAHNPAGARRLAEAVRVHWAKRGTRIHLVIGILADKDQPAIVRALAPVARRVTITQPPLSERTGDPQRMVRAFSRTLGERSVAYVPDYHEAFAAALATARAQAGASGRDIIVVTGSMFLVGALRERWLPERDILRRRSATIDG